ncbi:hypothetical protein LSH36_83g04088 [Paralvinella palmiformis]|uniref:PSP proline-rich domain-containing protein n=1 Tax=Paralvinella palmiformis TaxID=53620 RepID=A0AAD9K1X8_9ANNE|nr:hypothetical protein LSH36_83g04088 [Paralvinella palmiformis]
MDPPAQPLTDQEQIMLGAQQVALIQIHDSELETRAQQQHAMLEEEKLLKAQKEALALQQQQRIQAQERVEQQKEAELHHLQTLAMMEKEKEMMQTATALPGHLEGAPPPAGPPPAIMTQPAQPVVFMHPPAATTHQQQAPVGLPVQSQVPVIAAPQIISTPINSTTPAQEAQFGGHPPSMQEASFPGRVPPVQEPQFVNRPTQPAQEVNFPGQAQPATQEPPFSGHSAPPVVQESVPFGGQTTPGAPAPIMTPHTAPPSSENVLPALQKTAESVKPVSVTAASAEQQTAASGKTQQAQSQQKEIKLPQALEKVLAFKDVRAQQVGVKPEDVEKIETGELIHDAAEDHEGGGVQEVGHEDMNDEDDDDEVKKQIKKESKNKKRKKKKKRAKARKSSSTTDGEKSVSKQDSSSQPDEDIQIEYVEDEVPMDKADPTYAEFSRIFQAFKIAEPVISEPKKEEEKKEEAKKEEVPIKARGLIADDSDDDEDLRAGDDDKPKLSKKKQKKLNRLSVAELKQLVSRPDVVEMHDVTARDPKLLVHIKATRNSVPVPRHWCFKRKYLQGKRGIEKPPFDLPDFIKATGIMEMRLALQEKEDQKTMKSRMRERVRPKMGKIDIDYKKLHDAFFKWQVKPKLSIHGDLYYEASINVWYPSLYTDGKEFETRLKEKKPGNLSDELRTALGMPIGPNSDKYPPPWLIAMQRYGPPPSYPNLKIPGLNAPIPESCSFGYHAGGWGKPPVDESGKPLYGDVFGTQTAEAEVPVQEEEVDKSLWGELESESEEEEESEEESEEEGDVDTTGLVTPGDAGLVTPSGVTSIPMGVETPDMIELRKKRIEDAMDQGGDTPALYQVLPEKKASVGGSMMGSAHIYDMSAVAAAKKAPDKPAVEAVEVALNPDELDLDTAAMQAKYEQTVREQQSQLEKEDLSDMVAEHAAKQQKKRKKQQQDGKAQKKYKEFKF